MAVRRFATSGVRQNAPRYKDFLAGLTAMNVPGFESIATATGTGSSDTITFSSIDQTYSSLQIRYIARAVATGIVNVRVLFNGASTTFGSHQLMGWYTGTADTVSASGLANDNLYSGGYAAGTSLLASTYGVAIIDIHNYSSSTQNKTIRTFTGLELNGAANQRVALQSAVWVSTSAVTSISLTTNGSAFDTNSRFALYGIKAAA